VLSSVTSCLFLSLFKEIMCSEKNSSNNFFTKLLKNKWLTRGFMIITHFSGYLSFFSFCSGNWTQGLELARKALYLLSHVPCPFRFSVCFEIGSPANFTWVGLKLWFFCLLLLVTGIKVYTTILGLVDTF
jgi:hypothetical protein